MDEESTGTAALPGCSATGSTRNGTPRKGCCPRFLPDSRVRTKPQSWSAEQAMLAAMLAPCPLSGHAAKIPEGDSLEQRLQLDWSAGTELHHPKQPASSRPLEWKRFVILSDESAGAVEPDESSSAELVDRTENMSPGSKPDDDATRVCATLERQRIARPRRATPREFFRGATRNSGGGPGCRART